jgi:transposase-like protein
MAAGTAEKWRRRIAEQRESELSIAAFCRRHGLTQVSFHYWKRRLRDEPATPAPSRFLPISVIDSALSVTIERPDGLVLRVPCDERALGLVLRVLDGCSC